MAAQIDRLMALFERQTPDGTYHYSDADVRHYLPFLVIAAKVPTESLNADMQKLLGQFVVDAKLDLKQPAADVQAAIVAYYDEKPANRELQTEVQKFVREELQAGGAGGDAAMAALLGGAATTTGVLGGGVRPEGSVPAGPMARFAVVPPKK